MDWNAAWKKESDTKYNIIPNPKNYWLADTLLFQRKEKLYLFVEAFDKNKKTGRIGVLEFDGVSFGNFRIVLEKDYHLSYPYVFEFNDEIYMIPESSENKSVELYRAVEFPDKWEFDCKLLSGNFVDSTLNRISNDMFGFYTYNMTNLEMHFGTLNMDTKSVNLDRIVSDDKYELRAGGNCFVESDKIIRPVQYNKYFYGQKIRLLENTTYEEIGVLDPEAVTTSSNTQYRRLHTYSNINGYEAIDLSDFAFDILKPIKKLISYYTRVNK